MAGWSDSTRVNGLNDRDGLVSADNLGVGRSRNGNKEYVMKFGDGDVVVVVAVGVVAVVVDDDVVAVGGAIVGDAVGVVDAVDADDVVDVAGAVDDVVDFDDNSDKLVYYDDFDNSFDIDVPVGSYSSRPYDELEQVQLWLFQGVGMLGGPGSWNSSLVGNFRGLDKHLGLSISVLGLGSGGRGFGLDGPLQWLDLCRTVCRDQSEPFAVGGGCLVVVLEFLDEGADID